LCAAGGPHSDGGRARRRIAQRSAAPGGETRSQPRKAAGSFVSASQKLATPLLHTSPPRPLSSLSHSSLLGLTRFASPHEKTTNPGEREEREKRVARVPPLPLLLLQSRRRPARDPPRVPRRQRRRRGERCPLHRSAPGLRSAPARPIWPGVPPL